MNKEVLILGAIVAGIFFFAKKKKEEGNTSLSEIGASRTRKKLDWLLKNRHKFESKYGHYELTYYYEKPKNNEYKQKLKEFDSFIETLSFIEQALWNIPRHGFKVTQMTLYCFLPSEPVWDEIVEINPKL